MKAIISNRIYMTVEPTLYKKLEKELTYKVPSYSSLDNFVTIKNLVIINYNLVGGKMLISIPVGRIDLIPSNYEIVDKRSYNEVDFPEFLFDLRESQQEIHDAVEDNCIINAKVGWGKTFCGLKIAQKLGQKTLVITHTVQLRNQWEREYIKVFGEKPGIIGSGKFNIDAPLVVCNVQSLTKHLRELSKEFGTVLLDEMHHVSAPTFSKVIDALFCRFKIGLSGTLERKDQKHVVFKDYFSPTVYKPAKENTMTPEVHVIESNIYFPDGYGISWAEKINGLKESKIYKDLIIALADKYTSLGHKVLIPSDRVAFLEECNEISNSSSATLTGSVKDRELIIEKLMSGEIDQIWGSQNIVSEGLSINALSCLILATPVNNIPLLEQLIGRVIREHPGKLPPIIVDVRLVGNTVNKQYNNRLGHYIKEGYTITTIK